MSTKTTSPQKRYSNENWAVQDSNSKSQTPINKSVIESQQSQEVHNPVHLLKIYPELEAIVNTWPELPEHTKAAVKSLVDNANHKE